MKKLIILVFFLSFNVHAEPSETTEYLMSTPLSMMDWGLFRLKQHLNTSGWTSSEKSFHNAWYDWDKNQITIRGTYNTVSNKNKHKQLCKSHINLIRSTLGYGETQSKTTIDLFGVHNYFKSESFRNKNEPKSFIEDVTNRTYINVVVKKKTSQTLCEGYLDSDKVLFSE